NSGSAVNRCGDQPFSPYASRRRTPYAGLLNALSGSVCVVRPHAGLICDHVAAPFAPVYPIPWLSPAVRGPRRHASSLEFRQQHDEFIDLALAQRILLAFGIV